MIIPVQRIKDENNQKLITFQTHISLKSHDDIDEKFSPIPSKIFLLEKKNNQWIINCDENVHDDNSIKDAVKINASIVFNRYKSEVMQYKQSDDSGRSTIMEASDIPSDNINFYCIAQLSESLDDSKKYLVKIAREEMINNYCNNEIWTGDEVYSTMGSGSIKTRNYLKSLSLSRNIYELINSRSKFDLDDFSRKNDFPRFISKSVLLDYFLEMGNYFVFDKKHFDNNGYDVDNHELSTIFSDAEAMSLNAIEKCIKYDKINVLIADINNRRLNDLREDVKYKNYLFL